MCGIVGMATRAWNGFTSKEADAFFNMLYLDAMRGYDSTGVFGVDKHSNVQIHKEATQAGVFMQDKTIHTFRNDLVRSGMFAVGHNRAATRGSIKDENAHPFWVDDKIVLVQNGTWHGDHKKIKDTEVDTEALAHIIAEEADVEKALSKINAAYALCWFNTSTHKLHIVRNASRPMWMATTDNDSLIWASEPWFISMAAARNGLKLKDKPVELEPHVLVSLEIKENKWEKTTEKVNPFRHFPSTSLVDDDDVWPFMGEGFTPRLNPPVRTNIANIGRPSPANDSSVDHPFFEEAIKKLNQDEFLSKQDAIDLASRARDMWAQDYTKEYPVELIDCWPANSHYQCKTWHVYGTIISPEPDESNPLSQCYVHWFLYGKTAEEAMKYVTENFFKIKINNIRLHTFNDNKSLVTIGCNDHVTIPTKIETQVQ